MININPVWEQGIFGSGIRIRINDQGIDTSHNEFNGRFDKDASCDLYEAPYDRQDQEYYQHGTMIASILGGAGNNGNCSVGIAPNVTLSSCVATTTPTVDDSANDGTWLAYKVDQMDISQNSYGSIPCIAAGTFSIKDEFATVDTCPFRDRPREYIYLGEELSFDHPCDMCTFPSNSISNNCARAIHFHCALYFELDKDTCIKHLDGLTRGGECTFFSEEERVVDSLEKGAKEGRNGKGIVYVFSSGNHIAFGSDTNFAGRWQSRFIIYVGSVGKDGLHTQYSTPGASLFVVAPVGDRDDPLTMVTARAGGGCQRTGSGTSYASPIVSGVIALMLEVNSDLSWRDVQGILAVTSKAVTHTIYEDKTQVVNDVGLVHSNLYGFGIVDALAAVTAAKEWEPYGTEVVIAKESPTLNLAIGDDQNDPAIAQLSIEPGEHDIFVENVEVLVYLEHLSRGHLKISLTSPKGTVSELTPGSRPENGQGAPDKPWILRTIRSWGEAAEGTWSLSIADLVAGDVSSCVDMGDWQVQDSDYIYDCALVEVFPDLYDLEERDWLRNLFVDDDVVGGCCICGGGTTSSASGGSGCVDQVASNATCADAQSDRVCRNGRLSSSYSLYDLKDNQGRRVWDACCIAGGGTKMQNPDTFRDKLVRWEIRVYGHSEHEPSASPSAALPTLSPDSSTPNNTSLDGRPAAAAAAAGTSPCMSWVLHVAIVCVVVFWQPTR
ncbi:unnamed protein product [Cylindrotheca closterium]|uniref:subtilisin n=1 Tax=Cylindrotheca closterium TaxID=2856 RepID=A0AAD2FSG9_9STRA|nr:unnamed protein product [Cylindrotheca closterium]